MVRAFRQLAAAPSFSVPAVLGLALAIGASTAVFSVVHRTLLNTMGFTEVQSLVALWQNDPKRGHQHIEASYADYRAWRKESDVFADVALASSVNLDFPLIVSGEPRQVDGSTVSGDFFRTLGARPALGRLFTDADDVPGAPLRFVISYRLWQNLFGGDPGVVGRQVRTGPISGTIVGVAGPDFDFPRGVDLYAPLRAAWPTVEKQPHLGVFRAVARLRHGVSSTAVSARLSVVARQLAQTQPPGTPVYGVQVVPMLDEIFGPARRAIWLLFAAVVAVLLIACVNVANLLLARTTSRSRELGIRAALGAGRRDLFVLLFGECVALAAVSSLLGFVLAEAAIRTLIRLAPPELPQIAGAKLDVPVLLFGIAISGATVLLFGLAPALIASRKDANEALKQSSRGASADRSHARSRSTLIAVEVALSMVLLIGAGLLLRSFRALAAVDSGFDPRNVLTFRITTNTGSQEVRRDLYTRILDKLRALPGVTSAGAVLLRPLSGTVGWDNIYTVEGQSNAEANPAANYQAISPDYFRAMSIRLLAGRDFTHLDTHTAPGVVIVNESTARRHWPGGDAVGKRVRLGPDPKSLWLTVVGVVADVRYREWETARPDIYVPYTQRAQHRSDFVVKTRHDPESLAGEIRRAVFSIDPNQPVSNLATMEALVDRAVARARFVGLVLSTLACCALALATLGAYGTLSSTVAQRQKEMAIRMAIGATPRTIVGLVVSSGARVAALGTFCGLAAALASARLVSSLLYGVGAYDAASYGGAVVLLLAAVLLACVVPAVRAARVDPARTLAADA